MESGIWHNWMAIAFLSPLAWALACLFDVCLIARQIYRHPLEGVAISGLFFSLPLLFLLQHNTPVIETDEAMELSRGSLFAMLAALCYLLHLYFYFKTLFAANDVSNVEIFNLLSVVLVPLMAFMLAGEHLTLPFYLAIGLASVGILMMAAGHVRSLNRKTSRYIIFSVLSISLSMVLQSIALESLSIRTASSVYLLTGCVAALTLAVFASPLRRRLARLLYRFCVLFLVLELLETGGVLASQRATALGPSVSLVAVIECALPILIMLFSVILVSLANRFNIGTRSIRTVLAEQTCDAKSKCVALGFIAASILTVQWSAFV